MREIQATQAKAHLAELLRNVENGESIAITRHGKTVAHLIPALPRDQAGRSAAVDRLLRRRADWGGSKMCTDEILAARHEGHSV